VHPQYKFLRAAKTDDDARRTPVPQELQEHNKLPLAPTAYTRELERSITMYVHPRSCTQRLGSAPV
jgi:hypothetical protein